MRAIGLALLAVLVGALGACAHDPVRENDRGLPMPLNPRRAFETLRGGAAHASVTVLKENALAWSTRWQLITDAQRRIDATYFIVNDDVFGLAFLGHLYARAQNGVQVRLLVDARGTLPLTASVRDAPLLGELAAGGDVEVRVYNPILENVARSIISASAVPVAAGTHEKIVAVDGRAAITGGRNIGAEYFLTRAELPHAVEDADVLLRGDAAAIELARIAAFPERAKAVAPLATRDGHDLLLMLDGAMTAWLEGAVPNAPADLAVLALEDKGLDALDHAPALAVRDIVRAQLATLVKGQSLWGTLPLAPLPAHEAEVRIISCESRAEGVLDNDANDAMIRAIEAAKRHIVLETPYFLMTPRMLSALENAGDEGVRIDVLTNSPLSTDNPESQALFIDSWPELEARIPTLHFYVENDHQMLHAKRATFDDSLSFIGSYNIDPLSAHLDSEVIVAIWDRDVNAATRGDIHVHIARGDVVEYRIVRDAHGNPLRYPLGDPRAGHVVVAFGPRDHLPEEQVAQLEQMKDLLFDVRGIWDFDWVVW